MPHLSWDQYEAKQYKLAHAMGLIEWEEDIEYDEGAWDTTGYTTDDGDWEEEWQEEWTEEGWDEAAACAGEEVPNE